MIKSDCKITSVTPTDGKHYWFGYYDVCPWNDDESKMLSLRSNFMDHSPEPGEKAELMLLDPQGKKAPEKLGETSAWNWQMGCRLQWLPGRTSDTIFYNDQRNGAFVGVIKNIKTGKEQILSQAAYSISRDGKYGATLNFSRLHDCRPGYGYNGLSDSNATVNAPENDGVYVIDLESDVCRMIVSYAEISKFVNHPASKGQKQWINHLFWSPDDKRILFFFRYRPTPSSCISHLMAVDSDGNNLTELGYGPTVSHFDWQHENEILIYADFHDSPRGDYWLVEDPSGAKRPLWQGYTYGDGHCSWSPDKKLLVSDTYPGGENNEYDLFIYKPENNTIKTLVTLPHPKGLPGDCRCDLHARWSRKGNHICFDAAPNNVRQLFVVDLNP